MLVVVVVVAHGGVVTILVTCLIAFGFWFLLVSHFEITVLLGLFSDRRSDLLVLDLIHRRTFILHQDIWEGINVDWE